MNPAHQYFRIDRKKNYFNVCLPIWRICLRSRHCLCRLQSVFVLIEITDSDCVLEQATYTMVMSENLKANTTWNNLIICNEVVVLLLFFSIFLCLFKSPVSSCCWRCFKFLIQFLPHCVHFYSEGLLQKNANISAPNCPILKILFSAHSAGCPLSNYVKIGTRELVRNAEFAKFDTREN